MLKQIQHDGAGMSARRKKSWPEMTESDRLVDFQARRHIRAMAEIIYLSPGKEMPDQGMDQRWLIVEASDDGRFFGTGGSRKQNGEWVGYRSLRENDVSLEAALAAAERWAVKYEVPTIWVQRMPWDPARPSRD